MTFQGLQYPQTSADYIQFGWRDIWGVQHLCQDADGSSFLLMVTSVIFWVVEFDGWLQTFVLQ